MVGERILFPQKIRKQSSGYLKDTRVRYTYLFYTLYLYPLQNRELIETKKKKRFMSVQARSNHLQLLSARIFFNGK